jgi:Tfp pilus assembly protein PilO
MTIDKSKTVTLPVWLISVILSLLVTVFTFWGLFTATKATLELRTATMENKVEKLDADKVNKAEFIIIIENLSKQLVDIKDVIDKVDTKLETHMKPQTMVKGTSSTSTIDRDKLYAN